MNAIPDVERFVKDPSLLPDLCREVIDQLDSQDENAEEEMAAMDIQLREISKAVEKLEKQGVAVPDVLRAEKTRLASALGVQAESIQVLNQLADELDEILSDLKSRLGRDVPAGVKRKRSKRSLLQRTDKSVFRNLIIEALEQKGGSAHKNDILKYIGAKLDGKLLPGDMEWRDTSKDYVWQNNTSWERFAMVTDGILKADSRRGYWELSDDYKEHV
jgi:hypothetical protein